MEWEWVCVIAWMLIYSLSFIYYSSTTRLPGLRLPKNIVHTLFIHSLHSLKTLPILCTAAIGGNIAIALKCKFQIHTHTCMHRIPFNTEFKSGYIARMTVSSLVLFELCEVHVTSPLVRRPFLSGITSSKAKAWYYSTSKTDLLKLSEDGKQDLFQWNWETAFARVHTITHFACAHAHANQATLHNKATSYSQWLLLCIKWIADDERPTRIVDCCLKRWLI